MADIDWCEIFGWTDQQLEEIRYLGYSYIKQGKYEIAQAFFEALVAVDPQNDYDVQTLGAIFLQRGDTAKALFYLNQAIKLSPEHSPTLLNRAKALLVMGQLKEGLALAKNLKKDKNRDVSDVASALILAYS